MHPWQFGWGGIFGHVKSVVEKIAFSKGGVAWLYPPMTVWLGGVFLVMLNLQSEKLALVEV